ncbi:MAG: ABC transporter ATP-binding protein [Acidimicrobiia bacterium]
MDPVLQLDGVTAGYGDATVLRDVSLAVHAGEVVALLGPNGAGKTTTLLAVSGLVKVTAGTVRAMGKPIDAERPHRIARLGIAHVSEDRALFLGLTVEENLKLGLARARTDRKRAYLQAMEMFPSLQRLEQRRAGLLSGGEQQMLAMARALVAGPALLLVDEMSLGLAPLIVEHLLRTVRQIADDTGTAFLLVEQHVHLALEIADRGYLMSNGRIVESGTAAALADSAHTLEASYLGQARLGEPGGMPESERNLEAS